MQALPVHLEITSGQSVVFEKDFNDLTEAQNFFAWWSCQAGKLPQGAGTTRRAGTVDQWREENPLPVLPLTTAQAQLVAARLQ